MLRLLFCQPALLNPNNYASKKSLAQGMLDLALLSANAAQLKFVLTNWDHLNFREILLSLVILSIFLQVNFFCIQNYAHLFWQEKIERK